MDRLEAMPFPKSGLPAYRVEAHELRLLSRKNETDDTVTFEFQAVGDGVCHLPGQAIALDLPMQGGTVTRTFTIASSGCDPQSILVTVKAGEDAKATRWMHDHLEVGDEITGRGPFGRFTLAGYPNKPLLLIGAGSGFTPMMSMLRWLHARGETADVTVIQVARHVKDLMFTAELNQICADMPNLSLFDVVTSVRPQEAWRGYRGRPDRRMLRTMAPDASHRVAFCCGPIGFMDYIRRILGAEGMSADNFHTETFGAPVAKKTATPAAVSGSFAGVAVNYRGQVFDLASDEPLSATLAAKGQRIPTGCGQGQCGTCRVKLIEGDVEMHHQGGLSDYEVQSGYILACCTRPKGPISIADIA
jgi:ferredoxin-NADP reductase